MSKRNKIAEKRRRRNAREDRLKVRRNAEERYRRAEKIVQAGLTVASLRNLFGHQCSPSELIQWYTEWEAANNADFTEEVDVVDTVLLALRRLDRPDFESMTLVELRDHVRYIAAAGEDIIIRSNMKKADVITTILRTLHKERVLA